MTARWPLLRVLLTAHVSFTLLLWVPLMVVTGLIVCGIAIWGEVDRSIWHYVATQVTRWFALSLGTDAITTYLRLHLAHGRTRREFLRQLWPFSAGLAVTLAIVVTISYQLERGVYAMVGWPHRLHFPTVFGDSGNVLGILGAFTLMLLLWTLAGSLVGAAFARNAVLGIVSIPLGLLVVAPSETLVGLSGAPLFVRLTEALRFPVLTSVALTLAGAVLGCAAIWGIVRHMPLRVKVA